MPTLTELTAQVRFPSRTTQTQTPQPPSRHMNLVAVSCACSRMKVFSVISGGKLARFTVEGKQNVEQWTLGKQYAMTWEEIIKFALAIIIILIASIVYTYTYLFYNLF